MTDSTAPKSDPPASPRALRGLAPFLRPHRNRILLAGLFLVLAALTTLLLPLSLRTLIDQGFVPSDPEQRIMALREHFLALFGVGAALGVFSASRYYAVSWLGERITTDLKRAVYAHVLRQSPEFFERTQTGEVLSRLNSDTTLIETVVGSSLSIGLRNLVMGTGALVMLIITNPYVMAQVLGVLVVVVLPAMASGRRVRRQRADGAHHQASFGRCARDQERHHAAADVPPVHHRVDREHQAEDGEPGLNH